MLFNRLVGKVVKSIAIRAGGLAFDYRARQIECNVATAGVLVRNCVAQALSYGEAPRQLSHASA